MRSLLTLMGLDPSVILDCQFCQCDKTDRRLPERTSVSFVSAGRAVIDVVDTTNEPLCGSLALPELLHDAASDLFRALRDDGVA